MQISIDSITEYSHGRFGIENKVCSICGKFTGALKNNEINSDLFYTCYTLKNIMKLVWISVMH